MPLAGFWFTLRGAVLERCRSISQPAAKDTHPGQHPKPECGQNNSAQPKSCYQCWKSWALGSEWEARAGMDPRSIAGSASGLAWLPALVLGLLFSGLDQRRCAVLDILVCLGLHRGRNTCAHGCLPHSWSTCPAVLPLRMFQYVGNQYFGEWALDATCLELLCASSLL